MRQLNGQEMQDLCNAMRAFTIDDLRMFLHFHLEKDLDDVAKPGKKLLRIYEIVDHANRYGWVLDLLTQLQAAGPNPALKALAASLAADWSGGGRPANGDRNPLTACVVSRRAFVNREKFRDLMRDLCDQQARVAVIKGPNGGGNSHSWFFIEHLARNIGTVRARLVDLRKWKAPGGPTPDEVMESIAYKLGLEIHGWPPDDLAQGARRSTKLVDWLVGRSANLNEHSWLVIDHLDRLDLREETVELAEQLAVEVETRNCQNLSLVLIGFTRALNADLDPYLLRDAPAGFLEPQVRKHFKDLAAEAGHDVSGGKLGELIAATFEGLTPRSLARPDELPFTKEEMHEIGTRLTRLSAQVLRGEALQ